MIGGIVLVHARDPVRRPVDLLVSMAVRLLLGEVGEGVRLCEGRRVMVQGRSAGRQHDRHHYHRREGQAKHGAEESGLHVAGDTRLEGPSPRWRLLVISSPGG